MSEEKDTTSDDFRLTSSPEDSEADRKAKKAAVYKAWYEANKERRAAQNKAWREANKDKHLARIEAWNEANKEHVAARKRSYRQQNKDRIAAQEKEYREANKEVRTEKRKSRYKANREAFILIARASRMKSKYKLTLADFDELVLACDGRCPCCKTVFSTIMAERPCVDHCHDTGKIRGILCSRCNTAIGHAGDNPKVLRALAKYLERARRDAEADDGGSAPRVLDGVGEVARRPGQI